MEPRQPTPFERQKEFQQQLVLIVHSLQCVWKEQTEVGVQVCNETHCDTMKDVLKHLQTCLNGRACTYPHCSSSRQVVVHWEQCRWATCRVCAPVKGIEIYTDVPLFKTETELTHAIIYNRKRPPARPSRKV